MRLRGALQTRGEPWDECVNLIPPSIPPTFFLSGDRKTSPGWRKDSDWLACRNDDGKNSAPPSHCSQALSHSPLRPNNNFVEGFNGFCEEVRGVGLGKLA